MKNEKMLQYQQAIKQYNLEELRHMTWHDALSFLALAHGLSY